MGKCRVARQPSARRSGTALFVAVVTAVTLAGCAVSSSTASLLNSTVLERDRIATGAHDQNTARAAVFLRNKWGPVPLPESQIERWVAPESWAPTIVKCLNDAGFPGVRSADGGERLDFSGLRIIEPRALFEIDVATFDCQSRFAVRDWFADEVRAVEAPWALDYTRSILVPCLLAAGHDVPPLPADDAFRNQWRTESQFDPYSLVGGSPSTIARARADCLAPETILDAAS